jgi:hypothetical protein
VFLPGPAHDRFKVVERRFRVDNFEIHCGISLRTFSAGTTRPSSAARMPRSMAAAVSASTSTSFSIETRGSAALPSAMCSGYFKIPGYARKR